MINDMIRTITNFDRGYPYDKSFRSNNFQFVSSGAKLRRPIK
jgi:hypothetical protein